MIIIRLASFNIFIFTYFIRMNISEIIKHWYLGKKYGYEVLFKRQDNRIVGKPGIILADIGMPEVYEPDFYIKFMEHVFINVLPPLLNRLILVDRGIALIDPQNPLAKESFKPGQLIDMYGSFTDRNGIPYVDHELKWQPPGMKNNQWDTGYFLYSGAGKGGAPDISQKTAAKIAGWYFGHLISGEKVAWESQCRKIYNDAAEMIQEYLPDAEICHAKYVYLDSLSQAVEKLLTSGCKTIIYQCFCNPVYSDFEEYNYVFPLLFKLVKDRAKLVFADQLGNQPVFRSAYVELVRDQLRQIPNNSKLLLILSKHGHPFRNETMDKRGVEYYKPLEDKMLVLLKEWQGTGEIVWSYDEYAEDYWDPLNKKMETCAAYLKAIDEQYDYALEVPVEFIAENTDLMILLAMKKFRSFSEYNKFEPIKYTDWEQPLVRKFHEGNTTGIYTGCPVGKYRKYIVKAILNSILDLMKNKP